MTFSALGTLVIWAGNLNSALLANFNTLALREGSTDITCAISCVPEWGSSNICLKRKQVSGRVKLFFANLIMAGMDILVLGFFRRRGISDANSIMT